MLSSHLYNGFPVQIRRGLRDLDCDVSKPGAKSNFDDPLLSWVLTSTLLLVVN